MREALSSLEESYQRDQRHLTRIEADVETANTAIPTLHIQLDEATARYTFFQETKYYIQDLLGCLDEKVPEIEEQERCIHILMKEQAERILERRSQAFCDSCDALQELISGLFSSDHSLFGG